MVCEPNEHNFVKQTSYSVEIETDSAVVKEGKETKECTECGNTPEELGDFVSSTETETDENSSETEGDETITTEDDALIMDSDNSESQGVVQSNSQTTSTTDEETICEGEQDDDAYILDTKDSTPAESTADEEESTDLVPSGPTLKCSSCGFECPEHETPHYAGDSCPECKQTYLEKQ